MEWMSKYQELTEVVIRVMNEYSYLNNKQISFENDQSISFSEAQIIAEIMRNKGSNMSTFAKQMGVTKAAITKTMKKLEKKGFVIRYKTPDNNKNILTSVSEQGEEIYNTYQNYMYETLFKEVFTLLDKNGKHDYDTLNTFFKSIDLALLKIADEKL